MAKVDGMEQAQADHFAAMERASKALKEVKASDSLHQKVRERRILVLTSSQAPVLRRILHIGFDLILTSEFLISFSQQILFIESFARIHVFYA